MARQRICSTAGIIFGLAVSCACQVALAAEPKRVMLLHSFGREFRPWSEYAKTIRNELGRQSPWPLEIVEHSLLMAEFRDENADLAFVDYLRALHTRHSLDLIISLGAPAAGFVQRHREQLFPITPMVLTAVERRRVQYSSLSENDVVVALVHDYPAVFENILRVLPDTKTVAVVNGKSSLEQFWEGELRREAKPFENRIAFKWYSELSFEDILKDAAALPPRSAILWELMSVDAVGVVHEGETALRRLYSVANAPIFSYLGGIFGQETVGGPMHSVIEGSRQTVAVAIRILEGEKAADIKVPAIGFATPQFNWREMQRWGIPESRLPPGSEIHFRDPTAWEQYRQQILALFALFLLQSALIGWLIYERRLRHLAEVRSRSSMAELTYMNRRAAAEQRSATLAHEVNQPLAGIATKASAALRWLRMEKPDLQKAEAALEGIADASHRASDIIASVRAMYKKEPPERVPIDINQIILTVLSIVRVELRQHRVDLQTQLDRHLPTVLGDKVQLQQVVLNLVTNAIEVMHSAQIRMLRVQTDQTNPGMVRVSIEDTGTGIDPSNVDRIFKPLFTTKAAGMGMGLAICRSIIESHGGRIWGTPAANQGSIFQFELPISTA